MPSMHSRTFSDMCESACHVGCAPSLTSVSASSGTAAIRQSQVDKSNIGTPGARRSRRLPAAKQIGENINTAKAETLKS